MQDKRLSMIVLLLVTLIALAIITGCIARAVIAPPSIALIAPANGATGQATTLLLTWEATPGEAKNQKTQPQPKSNAEMSATEGLNEYFAGWRKNQQQKP